MTDSQVLSERHRLQQGFLYTNVTRERGEKKSQLKCQWRLDFCCLNDVFSAYPGLSRLPLENKAVPSVAAQQAAHSRDELR